MNISGVGEAGFATQALVVKSLFPVSVRSAVADSAASMRGVADELIGMSLNPNARAKDAELAAIRPSLVSLSGSESASILRWILMWNRLRREDLEVMREWQESGNNPVLSVLADACRVGILTIEENDWQLTKFAIENDLATELLHKSPLKWFEEKWSARVAAELRRTLRWGWMCLIEDVECRSIFDRIAKKPTGISHQELVREHAVNEAANAGVPPPKGASQAELSNSRKVLRTIAAASAIGAVWYTGWRWEPTMFGAYLAFNPESALNTKSRRAV